MCASIGDRAALTGEPQAIPAGFRWVDLANPKMEGVKLEQHYRDTLRKLAARRAIPSHQDGPRCRLYFQRDELDEWRRSARPTGSDAAQLRAVS